MPQTGSSGYINVNGCKLYYEDYGQGIPFVFVHGAFNTCEMWEPQIDELSRKHRVIVYDLPGHGRSRLSPDGFTIPALARQLDGLLTQLDATPAVIFGFSLGGCVAQVYASRYPEKLQGLILADTIAGTVGGRYASLAKRLARLSAPLISRRRMLQLADLATRAMQREHQRYFLDGAGKILAKLSKREILQIVTSLIDFHPEDLSRYRGPALVMVGAGEPRIIRDQAWKLRDTIPEARLEIITNSQHGPNRENPRGFNSVIEGFLDSLDAEELRAA